jgi:hypothetical protein
VKGREGGWILPIFRMVLAMNSQFANGEWVLKNMDLWRGLMRVVFADLRNPEVLRALRLFPKRHGGRGPIIAAGRSP